MGFGRISRRVEQDEEEFCAKLDKKTPDRIRILNRWIYRIFRSAVTSSGDVHSEGGFFVNGQAQPHDTCFWALYDTSQQP
jgi:hypothetical protein